MNEFDSQGEGAEVVEATFEERDIFDLTFNPKQELYFPEEAAADLDELAADILANGLRDTIEVEPDGTLISGHRRKSALMRLVAQGHEEYRVVQVLVRHDLAAQGERALKKRFLEANHNRRHLTPLQFARISRDIYELEHDEGCDEVALRERIAARFNISVKTLERRWALLDLPLELQRLAEQKLLSQQLGQQLLDHTTPEELEELRQLAETGEGDDVKARAKELLNGRIPKRRRREPEPEEVLDQFLEASFDMAYFFDDLVELVQSNLKERPLMLHYLRRLRRAEMVVPLLLDIVTRSDRLDQEDLDERPKLGKGSIEDVIASLLPKVRAIKASSAKECSVEEAAEPTLPPLVLRNAPPPLNLRKSPAA